MRRLVPFALAVSLALPAAPAVAAAPEIHAHRGGPLENGVPVTPENSMTAFKHARAIRADVVELDAKLTSDDVPIVMHDVSLDRTTDCAGNVRAHTAAEILDGACHIDIIGTEGNSIPAPGSTEPVPSLAEVLRWARRKRVRLNLEIKNIPTDADFDPTLHFADVVLSAVEASGIPKSQVLIQSFWPPNLDLAQLRGFDTSLLTLSQLDEGGILYGTARLYDWVSPSWPPNVDPAGYVALAHALGKKVVPYTLDTSAAIRQAATAGVDALITNDPPLAQSLLRP